MLGVRTANILPSRVLSVVVVAMMYLPSGSPAAFESETASQNPAVTRTITIRGRQFRPVVVKLMVGKPARLIFHNDDAELHAFVPRIFLDYVPLHIEGNGAPQFGPSGLVRIVIPSAGAAEIWYTPPAPGLYTYYCDMPGHQMVGQISVE